MESTINTESGVFNIRKIKKGDFKSLFNLMEFNRESLVDYFPVTSKNTASIALTKAYLLKKRKEMKKKSFYGFVVQDEASKKFISYLILKNLDWQVPKCEIAYMIDQNYCGKGLMTDFVEYICSFAFNKLKS